MAQFFAPWFFSGPYFGPDFFSGSQNDPCFQNKNSGCWALIFWQPQWILATLKWFHRLFLSIFKLPICYCQLSPHFVLLTFRTAFMLTYWLSQHDLRINNFVGFSYYSVNWNPKILLNSIFRPIHFIWTSTKQGTSKWHRKFSVSSRKKDASKRNHFCLMP